MKKRVLKIVLVLGLCLALVFSTATVAQAASTSSGVQMYYYKIYTNVGAPGGQTSMDWFMVYADGVWEPSMTIKNVQFEVWTTSSGNAVTFNATKGASSNWRAIFNISQFGGYKGTYHIDVYAIDALNRRGYLGQTSIYVIPDKLSSSAASTAAAQASPSAVKLYTSAASGGEFTIYASGLPYDSANIVGVNFNVYCIESNRHWYSATYLGNGKWSATASIANNANRHGLYKANVFTVSPAGRQYYIGTVTVNVP
jgi:hypothetical protein